MRTYLAALLMPLAIALGGCAETPADNQVTVTRNAPTADVAEVADLTRTIAALGPDVSIDEAARVARISLEYSLQLRSEYGVTDPALIHNMKVNAGLRPRGLCYQWADDLQARLELEGLQTLVLHRAIANSHTRILIDHSTVIVSAKGDDMFDGVVLDPWRNSGFLFWSPTTEDTRYTWVPREEVFARKIARRQASGG